MNSETPIVGMVMGSDSDWVVMEEAAKILDEFGIAYEVNVSSAHRMPDETVAYGKSAVERGLKVIIAGAGGAAHLPGVLAALTRLPVIGVPVAVKNLDGLDSLLSIVQMPAGVPVATVGIGAAKNAALLAVRMLAIGDEKLGTQLEEFTDKQRKGALEKGASLRARLGNRAGF
ncbi:MAG TPA: 5-(carboxyamino)imidazole ribonucleotide mutase [Candidatus Nanopelagicaceae bacterium]|nr:5-(carboxyamino)imidazole ribonucleotide mutase [Candidatus Nanopelagicaceae bacterium]